MQVREKVGKSWNTVFFQWFVAPEGRKVGSLKRRVRSQLARWEMKNCTPLWREAHFEVKMYNFWKLRCRKSARRCGAKHMSKSKCTKHAMLGPLLDMSKSKCTKHTSSGPLLEVAITCSDHFLTFRCRFLWQAQGIVHLAKSKQNVRVL